MWEDSRNMKTRSLRRLSVRKSEHFVDGKAIFYSLFALFPARTKFDVCRENFLWWVFWIFRLKKLFAAGKHLSLAWEKNDFKIQSAFDLIKFYYFFLHPLAGAAIFFFNILTAKLFPFDGYPICNRKQCERRGLNDTGNCKIAPPVICKNFSLYFSSNEK